MAVNLKYGWGVGGSAVATFASSLTALYLYVLPKDTGPEVFKGCRYFYLFLLSLVRLVSFRQAQTQ